MNNASSLATPLPRPAEASPATEFNPRKLAGVLRRRWRPAAVVAIVVATAVVLVIALQKPTYSSTSSVLIATHDQQQVTSDDKADSAPPPTIDSPAVDTRVEILQSRALAQEVVNRLHLERDPEFNPAADPNKRPSLLHAIRQAILPPRPRSAAENAHQTAEQVVTTLMHHVKVRRAGLTYVIDIKANAETGEQAAAIANAYADHFIADQLSARTDQAAQTAADISPRLAALTRDVQQADDAVQMYKIRNGLLSANGATLAEQEVSNYDQQLALARADNAEKQARLDAARGQVQHGGNGEDVGAALSSDTIRTLRAQEADDSQRLAQLSGHYGDEYPDVVKARQELQDTRAQINLEVQRIMSSLSADAQASRQRLASLQGTQNAATGTLASNNAAQVELQDLQRKADAARLIYQAYLNASKDTTSQQGTLQPDARVVSRGQIPAVAEWPKMSVALIGGVTLGLLCGLAAIVVLEMLNTGLETASEMERRLGLPSAGAVPLLDSVATGRGRKTSAHLYVPEHPFSAFAEAFRSLRAYVMLAKGPAGVPRTIAITSALPGEGKSLTAFCLAQTLALGSQLTVLVDCDLRRRGVSNLSGGSNWGLVDVLEGRATLEEALVRDERSGAFILRAARSGELQPDVFTPAALDRLLAMLSKFEVVVLDTAPVLAVAETRLIASRVDAVLMLTRWRRTPVAASRSALDLLLESGANVLGVALTQVDLRRMTQAGYGDRYGYTRAVRSYYVD
ncbi:Wzz/FepE/Etk N-terminal domain-containing protein [Caulobacter sp. S45]|uniref:GumC family protein n=1 Tax=Caulobacter sp. S45 TaxID=1641861 RepID=UPI00157543CD|nr:Wzz/FepE/Etk N-terminal domain-containing protein [Caulobacter sp. S45]